MFLYREEVRVPKQNESTTRSGGGFASQKAMLGLLRMELMKDLGTSLILASVKPPKSRSYLLINDLISLILLGYVVPLMFHDKRCIKTIKKTHVYVQESLGKSLKSPPS